jgi:hypothetical protein
MNDNDRDWFADQMEGLGLTYDKEVTDPLSEIYFRALMAYSVEQIERAVNQIIITSKFFPKPSELIELIEGSPDDQAAIAWEVANEAMRKAGYFQSVLFEDAAIGAALITTFGSWTGFCEAMHQVWSEGDASFEEREAARLERRQAEGRRRLVSGLSDEMVASKRKEFFSAYRNARREARATAYLPGHFEIENRNTVAGWSRGQFQIEDRQEIYKQKIYIARTRGGHFVEATFERATGSLIGGTQALLNQTPVVYLPPAKPRAMLTSGAEILPPEQGREFWAEAVKDAAGRMGMPGLERKPLTDDEREKRMRELRQQAERLEAEEKAIEVA